MTCYSLAAIKPTSENNTVITPGIFQGNMCTGPDPRSHYHVFILLQNMWGKAKFLQASGSMLEKADMRTKLNLIVDKRGQQREDCKDTMRCEFPVEVQWRIKQSFPKNGFCTQNTYMYALY